MKSKNLWKSFNNYENNPLPFNMFIQFFLTTIFINENHQKHSPWLLNQNFPPNSSHSQNDHIPQYKFPSKHILPKFTPALSTLNISIENPLKPFYPPENLRSTIAPQIRPSDTMFCTTVQEKSPQSLLCSLRPPKRCL